MKIKRVAMICVHSSPLAPLGGRDTGGMNVYVRELSRELGEQGLQVDIFTRLQDAAFPEVIALSPRVRVIHLKAGLSAPYDKNLLWWHLPEFVARLKEFSRGEGTCYDILHSHYWLSGWVAWRLRRSWGAPIIHRFHTLGCLKDRAARGVAGKESPLRILWERALMRLMNRVVVATPGEREEMITFQGMAPDRVEVIPCGVDTHRFRPIPSQEARRCLGLSEGPLVLFVGRIDPIKGIDTLIKAMAILTQEPTFQEETRLRLLVVGGDPKDGGKNEELEALNGLSARLGLSEKILFLPGQSQEKLAYFYPAADIVVLPSRYESFGMVALEAMACGTPVIASRVGGLPFTVPEEAGILVPEGEERLLAEKIGCLLKKEELRLRLGDGGVRWARKFRWPQVAEQVLSLYGRVMADTTGNLSAARGCRPRGGLSGRVESSCRWRSPFPA